MKMRTLFAMMLVMVFAAAGSQAFADVKAGASAGTPAMSAGQTPSGNHYKMKHLKKKHHKPGETDKDEASK